MIHALIIILSQISSSSMICWKYSKDILVFYKGKRFMWLKNYVGVRKWQKCKYFGVNCSFKVEMNV